MKSRHVHKYSARALLRRRAATTIASPTYLALSCGDSATEPVAPPELAPDSCDALPAPRRLVILHGTHHTDLIPSLDGAMGPTLETSTELLASSSRSIMGRGTRLLETFRRLEAEGHQVRHEDRRSDRGLGSRLPDGPGRLRGEIPSLCACTPGGFHVVDETAVDRDERRRGRVGG